MKKKSDKTLARWQKRWFVLRSHYLSYYEDEQAKTPCLRADRPHTQRAYLPSQRARGRGATKTPIVFSKQYNFANVQTYFWLR